MRLLLVEAVTIGIAVVAALFGRRELKKRLSLETENKQLEEQVDVLAHEEAERGPDWDALQRRAERGLLSDCPLWLRVVSDIEGDVGQLDLHCSLKTGHEGECFDNTYNVFFTQQGLTKWGDESWRQG
jgi:hypothetical protein